PLPRPRHALQVPRRLLPDARGDRGGTHALPAPRARSGPDSPGRAARRSVGPRRVQPRRAAHRPRGQVQPARDHGDGAPRPRHRRPRDVHRGAHGRSRPRPPPRSGERDPGGGHRADAHDGDRRDGGRALRGGGRHRGSGGRRRRAARAPDREVPRPRGPGPRPGRGGGAARFLRADVSRSADVRAMIDEATSGFGGLDILVNNAGFSHRMMPLWELPEEDYERVFATNVRGVYLGCKYAVPVLKERGGGVIVNTASIGAVAPRPGVTAYNATKGAVITLTRGLAVEVAPFRIRVNAVNPVAAETGFMKTATGLDRLPDEL